jgi:signal recognition particle subunit SEC65
VRESHNSPASSSENFEENERPKRFVFNGLMQAAIRLAKSLGLPLTHRNLYVIAKAIEAESEFREIALGAAVEIIRDGALAEVVRGGEVNYFFFEDCRWRYPRLTWAEREQLAARQLLRAGEGL